eukprot:1651975-Amphidinium_carterae.1
MSRRALIAVVRVLTLRSVLTLAAFTPYVFPDSVQRSDWGHMCSAVRVAECFRICGGLRLVLTLEMRGWSSDVGACLSHEVSAHQAHHIQHAVACWSPMLVGACLAWECT